MAFGDPLITQPLLATNPLFGSQATMPSLFPTSVSGQAPTSTLLPTSSLFGTPQLGSLYNPTLSYQGGRTTPLGNTSVPPGLVAGHFGGTAGMMNPDDYIKTIPFGKSALSPWMVNLHFGGTGGYVRPTPGDSTGITSPAFKPLPTGGSSAYGKFVKGAAGAGGMKLDPKIVAGLSQVPNFSYTPVTAGQAANVVGYTPQGYTATGYKPALMPEGKALWNTMPAYQMASPGEKKIFDAAIRQFNANAGNQIKQITDFAKAVQKLPSLAGPALAIARGEISPQANAAASAATRTANFMRLLGATGADIQRGVAANIGSSYTNA